MHADLNAYNMIPHSHFLPLGSCNYKRKPLIGVLNWYCKSQLMYSSSLYSSGLKRGSSALKHAANHRSPIAGTWKSLALSAPLLSISHYLTHTHTGGCMGRACGLYTSSPASAQYTPWNLRVQTYTHTHTHTYTNRPACTVPQRHEEGRRREREREYWRVPAMFPLSNQMTAKEVHQGEVFFCLHFTFGSERTRKKG